MNSLSLISDVRSVMKKILPAAACLLIFCTVFAAAGTSYSDAATERAVKVGLRYSTNDLIAEVKSDSGLSVGTVDGSGRGMKYKETLSLSSYTSITLSYDKEDGLIHVITPEGRDLTALVGDGNEVVVSDSGRLNGIVSFGGKKYRGGIMPFLNSSKQMNVINYLSLDDYSKGVVKAEIGDSYGSEAIKAQAMAAKNYAARETKHRSKGGFDVCTTTNCQVYSGVSGESAAINSAVDQIRGLLMYYDGELVQSYFFANSGGATENSEDVWTASLPYLRSIKDPYSPDDTWTVSFTGKQLESKFASSKLGTVTDVKIVKKNASGYVAELQIIGTDNTLTLKKDNIRTQFGASNLKSRLFNVAKNGEPPAPDTSVDIPSSDTPGSENPAQKTEKYYVSSGSEVSELPNTFYVVSSSGTEKRVSTGMVISDGSSTVKAGDISTSSYEEDDDVLTTSDASDGSDVVFTFKGRGNGHGVGMSQKSVRAMSKAGMSYDKILKFFYKGIEIK